MIAARLYRDYLEPERLADLGALLRGALDAGYAPWTLSAFAAAPPADRPPRVLLLRHDVDSDLARARRMWAVERELGITGSWFLRRSTWDTAFARELAAAGCDVGYHYEELADVVKARGAAGTEEARALLAPARALLVERLGALRDASGLALDVAASHGDFANRAVGVANTELLADPVSRREAGIRLEAYDVETEVAARASDGAARGRWAGADPEAAVAAGAPVVLVLLHPRAWGASRVVNARQDARRVREGCALRLRRRGARRP